MRNGLPTPEKIAEMKDYAHGYMRHLFPYGQDGVCHTAFGDLTYTVEVDEKSKLSLSMDLKTFPEGCEEGFLSREAQVQEEDATAISNYEISDSEIGNGEMGLKTECSVKTTLEVMNKIDEMRVIILEYGRVMREHYRQFLEEREEERNPSLRLMKEVADRIMKELYTYA